MKKLFIQRSGHGLKAVYDSDLEIIKSLPLDEVFEVRIKKARNYLFHKKYFALLNLAFDNQDTFDDFDSFRYWIQIHAGHFKEIKGPGGEFMYIPESISFEKLSEDEFTEVYNSVLTVVKKLLDLPRDIIENEIELYF